MDYPMWTEKDWNKRKNKITVTYARMSRDSQTKSRSFRVMLKYLKLYCKHSSLVGVKYLAEPQKTWWERLLWIASNSIAIFGLLYIVSSSYYEFATSPILTSPDMVPFRTVDLDFPGIAICPINRISRQAAMKLAIEIRQSNVTDLPTDEIFFLVAQLGNLYASEFSMDEERNEEIDQLLRSYYMKEYDIIDIMKYLSPQCSSVLLKCKLHGDVRNCSDIFQFRRTQEGFCCTFNYARENDDIPVFNYSPEPIKSYKVYDLGIERGLTVLMEPLIEDYLYPILPIFGWKVLVFNPYDYPDMTSGAVDEVLARPRAETYINLGMAKFYSTKNVAGYPIKKRRCLFPSEINVWKNGVPYSYSDCIVDCKTSDIQKICGCRPFYFPRRGEQHYKWRICTNADLECLANFKSKWWTVFPHDTDEIDEENFWALHCHICYPACDDISYEPQTWDSYMNAGHSMTDFLWNFTVVDHGVVHVYFSEYYTSGLKQDVLYYWYELMSDIGGICSVFIGFSLISAVELLYFVVLAIRDIALKRPIDCHEDDGIRKKRETRSEYIRTIYWNELMPRPSQKAIIHSNLPVNNGTRY